MAVPEVGEPRLPLTVDSPIAWAEFLIDHAALREYYDKRNIKCFNCCAAEAETFAQGAKVHEGGPWGAFDAAKVVEDLNELAKQHPFDKSKYKPPSLWRSMVDLLFPS
ncbi:MAG: hypothetical protein KF696_05500 [Planctomycetes bacterium]|nr:hypothetical protein [Planctomycetota bacterium]MCW8136341.1 hypothetical protein [Planctomycetota bacterium]